jgi:hypothetical protein
LLRIICNLGGILGGSKKRRKEILDAKAAEEKST